MSALPLFYFVLFGQFLVGAPCDSGYGPGGRRPVSPVLVQLVVLLDDRDLVRQDFFRRRALPPGAGRLSDRSGVSVADRSGRDDEVVVVERLGHLRRVGEVGAAEIGREEEGVDAEG